MDTPLTSETIYTILLRSAVREIDTENDALLWMTLLHTHAIILEHALAADAPGITRFLGLTQRGAAEVVAELWHDRSGQESHYVHWYFEWNRKYGYEDVNDMPLELREQLEEKRQLLLADPRIAAVEPDNS